MKKSKLILLAIIFTTNIYSQNQKMNLVEFKISSDNIAYHDSINLKISFKNISDNPLAIYVRDFGTYCFGNYICLNIYNQDSIQVFDKIPEGYPRIKYTVIKPLSQITYERTIFLSKLVPRKFLDDFSKYHSRDSVFYINAEYFDDIKSHKYFIKDTIKSNTIKIKVVKIKHANE